MEVSVENEEDIEAAGPGEVIEEHTVGPPEVKDVSKLEDGVVVGELMAVLLLCVCVLLRLLAPPSLPLCRGYSAGADN